MPDLVVFREELGELATRDQIHTVNQVRQMVDGVTVHFPEGTRVTRQLGGFVIWVELPGEIDTMQLDDGSIAAGFSFAPGRIFSASDRYRNCLRLSCGHPWSAERQPAIVKLGQLIKAFARSRGSKQSFREPSC
jgi:DNA-binding transcriptional MocR family regulator